MSAPNTIPYFLNDNFNKISANSYKNIFNGTGNNTNIDGITKANFNQILGFGSTTLDKSLSLPDIDITRTQNFFTFWNNKDYNFTETGNIFKNLKSDDYGALNDRNIIVTHILLLVFTGIMSSRDGVNPGNPLSIFTSPSDYKNFCKATENLQEFVRSSGGFGNLPIFGSGTAVTVPTETQVDEYWNKGYLNSFCNQQFSSTCKDGKITDKCIEDYRTRLSNNPIASSWCGCFTPLPTWEKKHYDINIKIPKQTCDNLCFKPSTVGYYNPPLVGKSAESPSTRIVCNATVCIIDDNKINTINSEGPINFNQICPCKPPVPCTCYINISKPGVLDKVKSGPEGLLNQEAFKQDCKNAICYKIDDATGKQIPAKCNKIWTPGTGSMNRKHKDGLTESKRYDEIYSTFWDNILLVIFILIFFELAYVEIHRYMERSKTL